MSVILAIDPGTTESGVVIVDSETYKPVFCGKFRNDMVLEICYESTYDKATIEMIQYYGKFMSAGQTTFDTCVWIGRFIEAIATREITAELSYRATIKAYITGMASAKDGQVKQVLIDRFAKGAGNGGKGYKKNPGWFYGFAADAWQAYALAVFWIDTHKQQYCNKLVTEGE